MTVTYSENVFVAIRIPNEKPMRIIGIFSLSSSKIFFFHIILETARFSTKKKKDNHKMCVLTSLQLLSETFSI